MSLLTRAITATILRELPPAMPVSLVALCDCVNRTTGAARALVKGLVGRLADEGCLVVENGTVRAVNRLCDVKE